MATSKLTPDDAQEWLESLQQVGEGWYRQVALAVRAGAHKALGMERREFAQAIGQRMIDPREAIIELHRDNHTMAAIADVLGVSDDRVAKVLAEEGLIEMTPRRQRQIETGKITLDPTEISSLRDDIPGETSSLQSDPVAENAQLREEIEQLAVQVKGAEAKRQREVKELKAKIAKYQHDLAEAARKARDEATEQLTEQERQRAHKEADAWAQEEAQKITTRLSHLLVDNVVSSLQEATNGVRSLAEQGAVTTKFLDEIERAHVAFVEELNVARMGVRL